MCFVIRRFLILLTTTLYQRENHPLFAVNINKICRSKLFVLCGKRWPYLVAFWFCCGLCDRWETCETTHCGRRSKKVWKDIFELDAFYIRAPSQTFYTEQIRKMNGNLFFFFSQMYLMFCCRREELKEKLRERVELERRALKFVEQLLEDSVTEEFLVDCVCALMTLMTTLLLQMVWSFC